MADINYNEDNELYLKENKRHELEEINKHLTNLQKLFTNLEASNSLDLETANNLKEIIGYLNSKKATIERQDIEEKIDFENNNLHF